MTAVVGRTLGDQPAMVPASVAHMNSALLVAPFALIWKSVLVLNTMPVGPPARPFAAAGMLTTSDCGTPLPSYSVDLLVVLSDTHITPVGLNAMPQPFCRLASV
jgi:hypothetical protein